VGCKENLFILETQKVVITGDSLKVKQEVKFITELLSDKILMRGFRFTLRITLE
jgi:hypothetical protein